LQNQVSAPGPANRHFWGERVPAVGLDAVAGALWDAGRGDQDAELVGRLDGALVDNERSERQE
jgi:hypothetical protein